MAKWVATQYTTAAAMEAAIEAIDNTVTIHPLAYKEGEKQKFMLVQQS